MKTITLSFSLLLASLGSQADDFSGHWRGLLQLAPEVSIVLGVELSPADDGYTLVLRSPNQHSQPILPSSFTIDGNTLDFSADQIRASFSGTLDGEAITGVFTQGRNIPLTLTRLSPADTARLAHEQQWFGDLQISRSASLPLVLNVAVIAGDYHVTLDSPKQQSFGIPVNTFSLSDEQLSFSSTMINASYQANWQHDTWEGTFIQGQAMPLTLKKKP